MQESQKVKNIEKQLVTNDEGKPISVILSIKDYNWILEELEELDDIRDYDKAKKRKQQFVSAEEAFSKIEKTRNK